MNVLRHSMHNLRHAPYAGDTSNPHLIPKKVIPTTEQLPQFSRVLIIVDYDSDKGQDLFYFWVVGQEINRGHIAESIVLSTLIRPASQDDWIDKIVTLKDEFKADGVMPARDDIAMMLALFNVGPLYRPHLREAG